MRFLTLCLWVSLTLSTSGYAEKVIWSGKVSSDGTPSTPANLVLKQKYQLRATGVINLGKWWQATQALANDACYEFNGPSGPVPYKSLKNSLDVSLSDGNYHADHTYQSAPFIARQNKVHFWVNDDDYNDNTGSFHVEILELE